jgi:hypothetical protein
VGSLSHVIRVKMFFFRFISKPFKKVISLATKVLPLITQLLIMLSDIKTLPILKLYHLVEPLIKKFLIVRCVTFRGL